MPQESKLHILDEGLGCRRCTKTEPLRKGKLFEQEGLESFLRPQDCGGCGGRGRRLHQASFPSVLKERPRDFMTSGFYVHKKKQGSEKANN